MAWKTLYVTGRPGFDKELLSSLEKSGINFLTGSFNADSTYLFWITDDFVLHDFRKVIGGRVIFKYRIRFYFAMEAFVKARDRGKTQHRFSAADEQIFRELND